MMQRANVLGKIKGQVSKRGFASMDKKRQKQIASLGGKAAHAQGRAHEFNSEEASRAGRLGGLASAAKRKAKKRQIALEKAYKEATK